jgi:predicted aspartyl protease
MKLSVGARSVFASILLLSNIVACRAAVTLDTLGAYLTKHGYGGALLVHPENFYLLPFQSNGKPGNFLVDTGSPTSLIFRSSLKRLDLIESKTTNQLSGAFGKGREVYGLTTIKALTAGNCTLTNVPVTVASGSADTPFSRPHSNGLLALRELVMFGAVLDLQNRLVYLRPSRPSGNVGAEIKSILMRQGYTPVPLSLADYHLRIAGALNGVPCYFLVDTGGYVTALNAVFAARAKLKVVPTTLVAEGLGGWSPVGITVFPSLRIGNYEIKHGSASIVRLNPEMVESTSEIAGLLGVEYLATNSAIFDFISGTMYLRPRSR